MTRGDRSALTTWRLLLVLLAGAAVGFLVLFADAWSWDSRHRDAVGSSAVVLWVALMCAQTAFWAGALLWLLPRVRQMPNEYARENRSEITGSGAIILAILVALAASGMVHPRWPNYLPGHGIKLGVLIIVGGLVGLVAAHGIWLVHGGLHLLGRENLAEPVSLQTYVRLRDELHRFLAILGAIIGLLVLSTGTQRRAVLAYAPTTKYGIELVLVYGLFFTMLVAAVYLPTYLTLTDVGGRIRDSVFPVLSPDSPEWRTRLDEREKLSALLQLERGPLGQMKASVSILAPLVGSLTGLLLSVK